MASLNFKERFKDKVSHIGKMGDLDVDSTKAVSKPPTGIQNKTNIQFTANTMLKNQTVSPTHSSEKAALYSMNKSPFVRPIRVSCDMNDLNNVIRTASMNVSSYEGVTYSIPFHQPNSIQLLKPSASHLSIQDNPPASDQ